MADPNLPPTSERDLLAQVAHEFLLERRRARRWSVFFRLIAIVIAVLGLTLLVGLAGIKTKVCLESCTAVVHVDGELDRNARASAQVVVDGLQRAFDYPQVKGVIVVINSPGGSAVQAGAIHDEMKRLRKLHPDKPLVAVVEEIAASGGYYVAVGADRILVNRASIVGSIGVIMEGFGFTDAMKKLGIERRVITAGTQKAFMDPFEPMSEEQRAHAQAMLDEVHKQFITAVREGRGDRLKETPEMFSGLVWNGVRAVELGLADGVGTVEQVARDLIQAEEIVDFTPEEGIADRVARRFGASGNAL